MHLGDYRVEIIPDTEFRLDGGAMFGVVPRKLWSQVCPPDDENRIRMNMNCVFIDTGAEKVLIETGIGDKWTAKQVSMYGIDRTRPLSETLKMRTGCDAGDVTIVVNTHLHFDHAGGNTKLDAEGKPLAQGDHARQKRRKLQLAATTADEALIGLFKNPPSAEVLLHSCS